jgi:hypothetical protein
MADTICRTAQQMLKAERFPVSDSIQRRRRGVRRHSEDRADPVLPDGLALRPDGKRRANPRATRLQVMTHELGHGLVQPFRPRQQAERLPLSFLSSLAARLN